jgi:hypothetical protein
MSLRLLRWKLYIILILIILTWCLIKIFNQHSPFQRKSKEESQGRNSGIEIVENKPYSDGPGGQGQYTKKIYHIAGHVPQYIKNVIPKSARSLHEEAWNAYPYARTKFSCEFVPRFVLDIESKYVADCGNQVSEDTQ